ncbi:hypothetical protein TCAL_17044 [Tigriopus californicus]|uniref:Uncharacterized protein n=1 Tax=Tigriopus californicus TaxID=6832 RepID=A0A553PNG9_TIGCA|nr:hypothetical protein TCAL_17044 [Tigriopus californicus]
MGQGDEELGGKELVDKEQVWAYVQTHVAWTNSLLNQYLTLVMLHVNNVLMPIAPNATKQDRDTA